MNRFWHINPMGVVFTLPHSQEAEVDAVRMELEMLCTEGKAKLTPEGYQITHEIAASFDRDEREILGLPRPYPYVINIKTRSSFGLPSFRYQLNYLRSRNDNDVIVNPKIMGAFITIGSLDDGLTFLFNEDQYHLIQLIQEFNQRTPSSSSEEINNENLYNAAKVKEYSGHLPDFSVKLSADLRNRKIVTADKLSITIENNGDGSYTVLPLLLHKTETGYQPDLTSEFDDIFKNDLNNTRNFQGANKTNYIFDKKQGDALQEIRQYNHITKDSVDKIMKEPASVFDSDVFCFDLEFFSDRVTGIGEFVHHSIPYIKQSEGSWLPEEGTVLPIVQEESSHYDSGTLDITEDNAIALYNKLQNAKVEGIPTMEDHGQVYRITPEVENKIVDTYRKLVNGSAAVEESEPNQAEEPKKEKAAALLIKDNLNRLAYRAQTMAHRGKVAFDPASGLKKNIHLYPHQRQGIAWMFQEWKEGHRGVLLADDMGLGKTVQAYGFLAALKGMQQGKQPSILIVAPVTLLKNWKNEFYKFVKGGLFDGVEELHGAGLRKYKTKSVKVDKVGKDAKGKQIIIPALGLRPIKLLNLEPLRYNKIVLTTYDTVRDYQVTLGQIKWSTIVLDEAQNIKNPEIRRTVAVKAMKYDFAIALTGTPVENTWVDLWSIMDFVEPGKLHELSWFNKTYVSPVHRAKGNIQTIEAVGGQLRKELDPLFLRRLKEDGPIAGELPPLQKARHDRVFMSDQQAQEYDTVVKLMRESKNKGNILQIIACLRDISLCPGLCSRSISSFLKQSWQDFFQSSARLWGTLMELGNIASQKEPEKVLIFLESKKLQIVLRRQLERAFASKNLLIPQPINGDMNSDIRQRIVDEFNNAPGFQILILSPKAAGVGLNITGANHVIHLSRCWNPAMEDQATSRAYRIGQTKPVSVYIPLAVHKGWGKGETFDEKLDALLEHKRSLSQSALFPVGDSAADGMYLARELSREMSAISIPDTKHGYWTIDDMSHLDGLTFEHVIAELYNHIPGYEAVKTPDSYDGGADVVVTSSNPNGENLLIQCKQTSTNRHMDDEGVKEVVTARNGYQQLYRRRFHCVVVTNARKFTQGAQEKANSNDVDLISYEKLNELLKKYPVPRI